MTSPEIVVFIKVFIDHESGIYGARMFWFIIFGLIIGNIAKLLVYKKPGRRPNFPIKMVYSKSKYMIIYRFLLPSDKYGFCHLFSLMDDAFHKPDIINYSLQISIGIFQKVLLGNSLPCEVTRECETPSYTEDIDRVSEIIFKECLELVNLTPKNRQSCCEPL